MPSFSPGMLGYGTVINGVSVVLRPFHDGFRVHANHRPCNILPYGGYVRSIPEAQHVIKRYQTKIIGFARNPA